MERTVELLALRLAQLEIDKANNQSNYEKEIAKLTSIIEEYQKKEGK